MAITINKLSPHIGAEIADIDLNEEQSAETVAEIVQAWHDNLILLFRGQHLDAERQLEVTSWFGTPGKVARPKEFHPKGYEKLPEGIMLISNIRENGEPIGALPDGEMMFHHDMMHAEVPHKATMLNAVEIPSHGGNTLFASGYAAYDTLADEIREPLEGRRAFHHYNYGSVQKGDGKGTPAFSESNHPVFRTHDDTGKKAIYVNRLMTEGVLEMDQEEADQLLSAVFDHAEKPEFVYEHAWQVGDLLLWDNRCSMHARTDFPETERRLLLRTTVTGDARPF
ncbi:MAG: TauD/TfdA family dioxygenase [Pseudomonadota bacterium]|mgnify:FL=1|jgi:taurine dioxygenase|nr:TauD/TfdA family dioxygenase [Pseudomonadota bacterium]|tara:strand:+ start:301 stop:1146 length:846 start_codon:yes stop_codon:yes gene_type:complete